MSGNEDDEASPDMTHLPQKPHLKTLGHQREQPGSVDSIKERKMTNSSTPSHNSLTTLESHALHNAIHESDNEIVRMLPCVVHKTKDAENNTVIMIIVAKGDIKSLASSALKDKSKATAANSPISLPNELSESRSSESKSYHLFHEETSLNTSSHESKEGTIDVYGTDSNVMNLSQSETLTNDVLNSDYVKDEQSETDTQNFHQSDDMEDSQSITHLQNVQNSDNVTSLTSSYDIKEGSYEAQNSDIKEGSYEAQNSDIKDGSYEAHNTDIKEGSYEAHNTDIKGGSYEAHNTDIKEGSNEAQNTDTDDIKVSQLKTFVFNFLDIDDVEKVESEAYTGTQNFQRLDGLSNSHFQNVQSSDNVKDSNSKRNTHNFQRLGHVELVEDSQLKTNSPYFQNSVDMKDVHGKKLAKTFQNTNSVKDLHVKRLSQNSEKMSDIMRKSLSKSNTKNFQNQIDGNKYRSSNHFQNLDDMKNSQPKSFVKNHSISYEETSSQVYVDTSSSVFSNQLSTQYHARKTSQEKIARSQMSISDHTLPEDSTSESISFPRPSKSPWGPPHKKYPEIYLLLNQPNQFTSHIPVLTRDSSTTTTADKGYVKSQGSHCCCSCMMPCTIPCAQNVKTCFVYPPFPMYCFQPVKRKKLKNKSNKKKLEPLPMGRAQLPTPAPADSHNKSKSPGGVWISRNENSNSGMPPAHSSNTDTTSRRMGRRPPTIICYICGQEYGTASIGIHEKQCLKKWKQINDQLPKSERRPEPVKISVPSQPGMSSDSAKGISGTAEYDLSTINDAAVQSLQQQYVKCDKCGRTFLPDSLKHHIKSCRGFHKIVGS